VHGEPGIGKTALLDYAAGAAADLEIARIEAVESEIELAFAGLHQLLLPYLAAISKLPPPQRDALSAAFGLQDRGPPDRFLIALALIEVGRELTPAQLAGQAPLPELLPPGRRMETRFLRQARHLPAGTQTLLLAAAADPTGDPALLWRAGRDLGFGPDEAAHAQ